MVDTPNTFQGTPEWYGGKTGILKDLVERAESESRSKYQPYRGNRIAPFTPLQDQSFDIARREAQNPLYQNIYGDARQNINGALGRTVAPAIDPFLQSATRSINNQDLNQFMNPYNERVVNQIATLGNRNLQENILPNVQNRFIGAGQYGSTGHQNFTNRAIRDTQEGISQAQGQALQGGFNTALEALQRQQGRQLEAGQIAGSAMSRDLDRQLSGGEALQNLAVNQQNQGLKNSAVLNQLGGQQQQQGQNELNTAFQEFQRERDYPYFQTARLNEIARGLPVNSQQFNNNFTPQAPQASPWTQGAGLLMGATGALNQPQGGGQRYAHGGHVKNASQHYRHYAGGGSLNPIQEGANHAIDTAELKEMRGQADRLQQQNTDPFWSAVSRAGFNLAANTRPNALANLGQAAGEGLTEYQNQLNNQDNRGIESAKIMQLIDNTKRLQAENNRKHQLELDKFGEKKRQFGMSHGIQQQQLGLAREKMNQDKELYESGLKGSKGKNEYSPYKKSNEAAIEEARKTFSTLPALKNNLHVVRNLAKKLDTGALKGRIAGLSPTLGSVVGVGDSADIDQFDAATNEIILDLGNQLKGSQVALGKLKIIEKSKMGMNRTKKGNLEIIDHMDGLATVAGEKARFIKNSIKNDINAIDAEDAFNQYADAKLTFEEEGKKFTKKPEDFLQGMQGGFSSQNNPGEIGIDQMTDEELLKIAEGK